VEPTEADGAWRIDELAQRSGTSVDTIRFYRREGLLPPARRSGRALVYGVAHLRALELIHDLQARHFSLGAIKTITEEGRLGLVEALFIPTERTYTREQLLQESRIDPELMDDLEAVDLLTLPDERGREGYDVVDLRTLEAIRGLLDLGMPRTMVILLAKTYVGHITAMQEEVLSLFARDDSRVPTAQTQAFESRAAREIDLLMPLVETLLENVHRRAVQRMTFRLMQSRAPFGGGGR
jgi:DNA-binding transcriptional MerR regulator